MINTLHIKNIGIIDDLSIDLNKGFNVLTGETGAGKTLIIDSLSILAGGRFSKEMIKTGEEHSYIELCLYLPNHKENIDGNIIISREVYANGRNLCKINGRMVTVTELKEFMEDIIDIHGQHENQTLLETKSHIKLLDEYSGEELEKEKSKYLELFEKYNQIKINLKENYGDDIEKQRRLDLLKYQVKEIEIAKLKQGEEEEIEAKRKLILNSEKISENLNMADMEISENAIDSVSSAIKAIEKIEGIDNKYSDSLSRLKNVYYELQETGRELNSYREDTYFDEEARNEIETRLDLIFSLKRKYGNNIEEILNYEKKINEEIEKIENLEQYIYNLKEEKKEIEEQMNEICIKLNSIRKKESKKITEKINKELKDLEMKNAKFEIQIEMNEQNEFNTNGLDKIEFLICTNTGDTAKPLSKIASGGEMSRIMLAIKTVLAEVDNVAILVFDEIDTGISGMAAKMVAEKLKTISKKHQVLCVTHLASIAAKGDYHYYISKNVLEDKTKTNVELLKEEKIIHEIARIASGEITDISLQHAKELRAS